MEQSFFDGLEELCKTLPTSIYLEKEPCSIPKHLKHLKISKTKIRIVDKTNKTNKTNKIITATQITGTKEDLDTFVSLNNLEPLTNYTLIKDIN